MKAKTKHEANGPKIRVDCWAAMLTPDQQWQLYRKATQCGDWNEALAWAKEGFHLDLSPSRSSFYHWMGTMRKLESEQRLEAFTFAIAESRDLGKKLPKAEFVIMTLQTLSTEAALKGNLKAASTYANIASTFQSMYLKMRNYKQKLAERKKREAGMERAVDAGRRSLVLSYAKDTGKPFAEAAEEYVLKLAHAKKVTDRAFGPYL